MPHSGPMAAYALTIFAGAFLLFQVQPLMGKYILPWFGGGPGVWTTCLLFFQTLLVGGYAYAHGSARWLKPRAQAIVHLALLAGALALLPIIPGDAWKPSGAGNPTWQILRLLAACLGLPYLALAATSPLLQHWFSRTHPGTTPYRLYALSNFGSLLALLSYPFFFEPHCTRLTQARLWAWGLVAYAIGCGFCAVKQAKAENRGGAAEAPPAPLAPGPPPSAAPRSITRRLLWLLLPACASALLLAVTNKLCQDVASIPFLWILPLALYLLSFIICFDSPRWYRRVPYALALVGALAALGWALFNASDLPLRQQLVIYGCGLFLCCMVCHGELYRLKPPPEQLTGFYLAIALGSALGGLFVAVGAPLLFTDYYELHWGLLLCGLLFVFVCLAEGRLFPPPPALDRNAPGPGRRWLARLAGPWFLRGNLPRFRYGRELSGAGLLLGVIGLGAVLWWETRTAAAQRVFQCRNFYGTLTVYEYAPENPESHCFLLQHGRIAHGVQFASPERAATPVSYYGPGSGIWLGMNALPPGPRRIGVAGLGAGSMAVFARAGDYLRFYEINPQVEQVAAAWFTYLTNCPATVEIATGDARLSLEHEPPQNFDLLVLDAFNSDAVPVHLLTREAFAVYRRHLRPGGVIAINISNHHLNLKPVVANLARHFHCQWISIDYEETDEEWWLYSSTWALMSDDGKVINSPAVRNAASSPCDPVTPSPIPLWTDDFVSLFQILY